jgi:molybdopterin biosynthesis enzyme
MRPIRETIAVEEALELVLASVSPIARTERVALRDANNRVLASPAVATVDVPPFDRAAMAGYAVIAEDTSGAGRHDS